MAATLLIGSEVTETGQNITTEHLLFTYTASGEQFVAVQICYSNLNAAAASLYTRLEHTLADATVLAYNRDLCAITKWAASNTTAGMRLLGPVLLLDGEKLNVYGKSDNASDTNVTYKAKVINAAYSTSANLTGILGTALTETGAGYLAAAFKKLLDVATPVLTAASANQTGDAYGVVTHADYGNAHLVRSTTPANTLDVDVDGKVDLGAETAAAVETMYGNIVVVKAAVYDSAEIKGDTIGLSNGARQTVTAAGRITAEP